MRYCVAGLHYQLYCKSNGIGQKRGKINKTTTHLHTQFPPLLHPLIHHISKAHPLDNGLSLFRKS